MRGLGHFIAGVGILSRANIVHSGDDLAVLALRQKSRQQAAPTIRCNSDKTPRPMSASREGIVMSSGAEAQVDMMAPSQCPEPRRWVHARARIFKRKSTASLTKKPRHKAAKMSVSPPTKVPKPRRITTLTVASPLQSTRTHGCRYRPEPRCSMIFSATRHALAMMVSVGFAPVPVGKGDPSTA